MLTSGLLAQAGIVALVSLLLVRVFGAALDPLRSLPGPFAARFTVLWYFRCTLMDNFRWQNVDLHAKYGKLVRLAPDQYSVDDPDIAKQIYGNSTSFAKSEWYDFWKNPDKKSFQDIFSIRDPQKHAHNRKVVASLYSMTNLIQMESCVDESIALLVKKCEMFAKNADAFDLLHWMRCYAFDAIFYITVRSLAFVGIFHFRCSQGDCMQY